MGFAEQLRAILGAMSDSRQTLLFSATLPAALAEFARAGLRDPELVRLDVESKLSPDLGLAFFTARSVSHNSRQCTPALLCVCCCRLLLRASANMVDRSFRKADVAWCAKVLHNYHRQVASRIECITYCLRPHPC